MMDGLIEISKDLPTDIQFDGFFVIYNTLWSPDNNIPPLQKIKKKSKGTKINNGLMGIGITELE